MTKRVYEMDVEGSVESNKRTKKFLGINKCKGKIHEKKAAERPLKC